jgi:protein Tex
MNHDHARKISSLLSIPSSQVEATAALLTDGATVPFIARYRKEKTGQLDEVQIAAIRDGLERLGELDSRKKNFVKSLVERDLLSDELQQAIDGANDLTTLEDIYLPYRPKRRTRAGIAREKGLEPLALSIFGQASGVDPAQDAGAFINDELAVADAEEALAGARDIIAEWINEDAAARSEIRHLFEEKADVACSVRKGAKEEGAKYRDYFDWKEGAKAAAGHRMLAMFRGEKEGVLSLRIKPSEAEALDILKKRFVSSASPASQQVELAAEDAYKRLTSPSMEAEYRAQLREKSDTEAIGVFASNLRELMLAAPLGQKTTLALDPAYRTGCKTVCLDRQGKLLVNTALHITSGDRLAKQAAEVIVGLCKKFNVEAIAIGNGTASRETEAFVRALPIPDKIQVVMVNESGASVYSASAVAREEFPDKDITVRGAVSIGRRLMDPLSELVKLDPKAIGVGQYQHDVDQARLKKSLDDVVMSCVNHVGVELNTASKQLLSYVSGLGPKLAGNIVEHRNENGPFKSRAQLKKVSRLGAKAYEQAAGFLRIRDARNPLDCSAVHPERYKLVDRIAGDLGCTVKELINDKDLRGRVRLEQYVTDDVGIPTLQDIMQELDKPGRDPRQTFEAFAFADEVHSIADVKAGMKLPGIVTNVTRFGAFVDIGAHQDGLVHISQLADRFVNDPADVVKVNQKVNVTVVEVDLERKRIALSMKSGGGNATATARVKKTQSHPPRPPRKAQGFANNPFGNL